MKNVVDEYKYDKKQGLFSTEIYEMLTTERPLPDYTKLLKEGKK